MTLMNSIRAAFIAAVLASAGFGQSQTANHQQTATTNSSSQHVDYDKNLLGA